MDYSDENNLKDFIQSFYNIDNGHNIDADYEESLTQEIRSIKQIINNSTTDECSLSQCITSMYDIINNSTTSMDTCDNNDIDELATNINSNIINYIDCL